MTDFRLNGDTGTINKHEIHETFGVSNYFLADLVAKMNVASRVRIKSICVKNTFVCIGVLRVFEKQGLIYNFRVIDSDKIIVYLKYYQNKPVFAFMETVSKPGKRVYWTLSSMSEHFSKGNFSGFFIIATSRGFVTSNDCILGEYIGGEVLVKIYI